MFTLLPLITNVEWASLKSRKAILQQGRAHHGQILDHGAELARAGKLRPLLNDHHFSIDEIEAAHALVASGAVGKVVVELQS